MDLYIPLSTVNFWCAVGGLVMAAFTLGLYYDYFFNQSRLYTKHVAYFEWQLVILSTVGGVAMTLLYSEYFGFVPCSLCWLQRIALYPQALFSIIAYQTRERIFFPLYSAWLSGFGFLVAVYNYVDQMLPKKPAGEGFLPCLADGSVDCAEKIINEFGFVTFPMLSATLFLFLIAIYLHMRRRDNE